MRDQLNSVIINETAALNSLLELLDIQHSMLIKNDVFGLEDITGKIQLCNKKVAECEVERRKLTAGEAMSKIVNSIGDSELEQNYRKIKRLVEELKLQKDTNEMLIKQGLGFTTRMLNIINPDRNIKTYNSYGKLKKSY